MNSSKALILPILEYDLSLLKRKITKELPLGIAQPEERLPVLVHKISSILTHTNRANITLVS